MHECVCVALSRVCLLLLLLCVRERVFCVSVHACGCVDVDGWVRWRFFFATSNLKSVCSLSLNILLVYLCVCVLVCLCGFDSYSTTLGFGVFFAQMLLLLCFCGCARSFPEILTVWFSLFSPLSLTTLKKGKQRARRAISPKKVRRGRTNRGGPEFFFLFCFIVLSKKQQHRHFIQSFR